MKTNDEGFCLNFNFYRNIWKRHRGGGLNKEKKKK